MKPHRMVHLDLLLWVACLWLFGGWADAAEKNAVVSDYQVKAAFLCNLIKFTDWPPKAIATADRAFVIGIMGEDPFGKTLDDAVSGEVVRGRPLIVKRLHADEDLRSCQVLFISRSEMERLPLLLNRLKGSSILTVGDVSGFGEQGGMVNLILVQNAVKMEINQAVAEQAGLQISAKVLKLARIARSK